MYASGNVNSNGKDNFWLLLFFTGFAFFLRFSLFFSFLFLLLLFLPLSFINSLGLRMHPLRVSSNC